MEIIRIRMTMGDDNQIKITHSHVFSVGVLHFMTTLLNEYDAIKVIPCM